MGLIREIDSTTIQQLCHKALGGMGASYSPYSHFPVSAALLSEDGRVFSGANVENSSFGLTVCAERVAIWKAVTEGARQFQAMALTTNLKRAVSPCGACRQVLAEFAPNLPIYSVWDDQYHRFLLNELLPDAFTPGILKAERQRLDLELLARGLVKSREEAQRLILAGLVVVGEQRVDKPGTKVDVTSPIRLKGNTNPFVSRAGLKLEGAIAHFGVAIRGRHALDCGISTGGFTHYLLANGAEHVIGVDVGYGQVAEPIRTDSRVTVMERTNLRAVTVAQLPFRPDLVTLDVSFISLTLVLPVVSALLAPGGEVVALVKPQFEVGRGNVGKGGIVRDPVLHRGALEKVIQSATENKFLVGGVTGSGLPGTDGNREFFLLLRTNGEAVPYDLDRVVGLTCQ